MTMQDYNHLENIIRDKDAKVSYFDNIFNEYTEPIGDGDDED